MTQTPYIAQARGFFFVVWADECRTEAILAAKHTERTHVADGWRESEAETIAARTAVAALIARNAELEADNKALRGSLQELVDFTGAHGGPYAKARSLLNQLGGTHEQA